MHQLSGNHIRISVRNLVEFILRSGNLDHRIGTRQQQDAMMTGSRLHRKIQASMPMGYQAEVTVKYQIGFHERSDGTIELFEEENTESEDNIVLQLEGRADGVFRGADGRLTIDEIKVVRRDFEMLREPDPVHVAQALCYAYVLCTQKQERKGAALQLTYCHPESEEIKHFLLSCSYEELKEQFYGYIQEYGKWMLFLSSHRRERNCSVRELRFPYPYRKGQKQLAAMCYRAIRQQKTLLLQAPTGIGKTLAVLFPAVWAIGEGYADKLFYLTAKNVTRAVAEEGLALLREQGLSFSGITITAKEKLCLKEEMNCNPLECEYAEGHFDRVNQAVFDLITHENNVARDCLLNYAKKHRVCPFEMALDVTYWVDVVICDYNYVYDPNVRLQRYFAEGAQGDYIFAVDEVHNLVDRAREMYSAGLKKEDFLLAKKWYGQCPAVLRHLNNCNRKLLELKRECEKDFRILSEGEGTAAIVMAVETLYTELCELPEKYPDMSVSKEAQEFFFRIREFLLIEELRDDHYSVYTQLDRDGNFWLKLQCVDPSRHIVRCGKQGLASIFFSATLLPIPYYKELLTGDQETDAVYVQSPFDSRNRLLLIAGDASSRYVRRNRRGFERMADYIWSMCESRSGNYLVFFPSYSYLQQTTQIFCEKYGWTQQRKTEEEETTSVFVRMGHRLLLQNGSMREADREAFLSCFRERKMPTVGFCVMGGVFSEGIDLQGEAVIGVVVIGTGLPQIGTEREILKQYFEERGMDGYAFAYRYPGMNKVLQAAGRLIRTDQDKGVILLLDDRFLQQEYQELFPVEWREYSVTNVEHCRAQLRQFWNSLEASKERTNEDF